LARDIVPAYFLSPRIGRYDDIWASYLILAISHHLGDLIAYGSPLVRQDRNPHDYWKDLDQERPAMRVTDRLCAALRQIRLSGTDYGACFGEIEAGLRQWVDEPEVLAEDEKSLMVGFLDGLSVWSATIARTAAVSSTTRDH
jgi:hypothetical protein